MTEFKVMAGDLMLGITSDYAEALCWVQTHDKTRVCGPRASSRLVVAHNDIHTINDLA